QQGRRRSDRCRDAAGSRARRRERRSRAFEGARGAEARRRDRRPQAPRVLDRLTQALARPLARLIDELSKLPGVGPKTAQRLAYYILRASMSDADALASGARSVKTDLRCCSTCFNIAEADPGAVCAAADRDLEP